YDPFFHYVAFRGIVNALSEQAARVFRFHEQEQLHEEIIDTGLARIYQSHLEVARRIAHTAGMEIRLTLLTGKAFAKILHHVQQVQPWLLVLGRIGIHSQQDEMDLGSNAENLLRLAPCHVLLSHGTYYPPLEMKAQESVNWTREAEERMDRVPAAVRDMVRSAILRHALESGHSVITAAIVEQALKNFISSPPERSGTPHLNWTGPESSALNEIGMRPVVGPPLSPRQPPEEG
ncbi:MAG: hypothetical protein D6736_14195, partial [Nitrospinota bacterium]